jgi:hypothetical protein
MRGKKRPESERMRALALVEVGGVASAARQTGLPESTIRLWMDRPEYAELRAKTRDELRDGFKALAHLAMTRLMEAVESGSVEPRDLAIALGIAVDKHLLMSGDATARTETRTWSDSLDDDEKRKLRDWIDGLDDTAAPDGSGETAGAALDAGAEVR